MEESASLDGRLGNEARQIIVNIALAVIAIVTTLLLMSDLL
jgi:hypothetical protein